MTLLGIRARWFMLGFCVGGILVAALMLAVR